MDGIADDEQSEDLTVVAAEREVSDKKEHQQDHADGFVDLGRVQAKRPRGKRSNMDRLPVPLDLQVKRLIAAGPGIDQVVEQVRVAYVHAAQELTVQVVLQAEDLLGIIDDNSCPPVFGVRNNLNGRTLFGGNGFRSPDRIGLFRLDYENAAIGPAIHFHD